MLGVTHADLQAQIHLPGGSADHDGPAASTSKARKHQHYVRSSSACVSFDERSHRLANLAVERFGRLGVGGSKFISTKLRLVSRAGGMVDRWEGKDW